MHNFTFSVAERDNRELKQLRRRPWIGYWKMDSASFQTISRFSEVVLLLKRRGFRLELKRGGSARVQIEMVEFIALPFSSSKKLKIWSFHVVVEHRRQRNVQKSVMHVQSCCFTFIAFWRCGCDCGCGCRRRRSFARVLEERRTDARGLAFSPFCIYLYIYFL